MIPAGIFNQGSDAMIVEVRVAGFGTDLVAFIYPSGTTDINVDWGDGTSDYYNTAGVKGHYYSSAGTYMIKITGSLQGYGTSAYFGKDKVYAIHSWGNLGLKSLASACYGMVNIEHVAKIPTTVTNTSYMFVNTPNFNGDISGWNVSNVTNMDSMFGDATAFNQDLSGWCVINIPYKPLYFDLGTPSWILPKPIWGTCP